MPRSSTPALSTQALVEEVARDGSTFSARRLEDWIRWGLVPKGIRRGQGRGKGSVTVFAPDMVERCREVARRMRRGTPWQNVALSLFGAGLEVPEETLRRAYRWAYSASRIDENEALDKAEESVQLMAGTRAGRRLLRVIQSQVRQSKLFPDESPDTIAHSVMTNVTMIPIGALPQDAGVVLEMLTGLGLPLNELSVDQRTEFVEVALSILPSLTIEHMARTMEQASLDELKTAMGVVDEVLEALPERMRTLIPYELLDMLHAVVAPAVIQIQRAFELEWATRLFEPNDSSALEAP
jgi:hypothetical protein